MRRVGFAMAAVAMLALAGSPTGAAEPDERTAARTVDERGRQAGELAESRGALGSYFDAQLNRYVIAVARGARSTVSAAAIAALPGEVVVEERDIDQETIDAISERLEGMRKEISEFAYAFGFDPITGRILLQSEAPRAAFRAIEQDFPGLIDFRLGEFSLAHRFNDTSPYKGGAMIRVNGVERCTSGFTMRWSSGTRRMITAGHCMTDGTVSNMGQAIRSSSTFPYYDIEQISGQSYGGYIYDEDSGWATVKHAGNPAIGGTYCTTGDTTGIFCNWKLRSLNVTICYTQDYPSGACAHSLAGFDDPATGKHVQQGDSGAPLWIYWNQTTGVGIRGVVSGYFWDMFSGRWVSYATQYNRIATEFGGNAYIP